MRRALIALLFVGFAAAAIYNPVTGWSNAAVDGLIFEHSGANTLNARLDFSSGAATIDWGDGSASESMSSYVNSTHAYSAGTHTVVMTATESAVTRIDVDNGNLTSSIPSLTAYTTLTYIGVYSNQLTGSIPSLAANTALATFSAENNQLTGSIPSLAANTALVTFSVYSNQLTGSIPSLAANTALVTFRAESNQLTGSIPSLTANTALTYFRVNGNQLTGYVGGLDAMTSLTTFNAGTNALTETAINDILIDLDTARVAGNPTCTVTLNGGTNAAPTGAGATAKTNLTTAGWTVTTT